MNLKKTEFIYFRGPGVQRPLQEELKIGGEKIRQVDGVKFLGVWVDEGLRWTTHIGKVKTKVGQLLGVLGVLAICTIGIWGAVVLFHLIWEVT